MFVWGITPAEEKLVNKVYVVVRMALYHQI